MSLEKNHQRSNAIVVRGPFFAFCRTKTLSVKIVLFPRFLVSHHVPLKNLGGHGTVQVLDQKKAATHVPNSVQQPLSDKCQCTGTANWCRDGGRSKNMACHVCVTSDVDPSDTVSGGGKWTKRSWSLSQMNAVDNRVVTQTSANKRAERTKWKAFADTPH